MTVTLAISVQHHPARAEMLPQLLERLPGAVVVSDPEPEGRPNTLRTYRECLRALPPEATHLLVIQDDAWPCEGFVEQAAAAVAERPEDIVCFYLPGSRGLQNPVIRAREKGERWAVVRLGAWVPTVATSFPVGIVPDLLAFLETPRMQALRGDDGPLTMFCKRRKIQPWAVVPSLVQHEDRVPSLIGRQALAGRNRARVAAFYVGDDDPRI